MTKKHTISFVIVFSICAIILIFASCNGYSSGCSGYNFMPSTTTNTSITNYTYANSDKYLVGNAEYTAADIKNIDLSWICGSVKVEYVESDKIALTETSQEELTEEELIRTCVVDETLFIKYIASTATARIVPVKQLKIALPQGFIGQNFLYYSASADLTIEHANFEKLESATASGRVNYSGVINKELKLSTASGNITAVIKNCPKIDIQTASADVDITADSIEKTDIETASGEITVNSQTVDKFYVESSSGDIKINSQTVQKINVSSSSGKVNLTFLTAKTGRFSSSSGDIKIKTTKEFSEFEAITTSGDVTLIVNKDFNAKLEFKTKSGRYSTSLLETLADNTHTFGEGSGNYYIQTNSGSLKITAQ